MSNPYTTAKKEFTASSQGNYVVYFEFPNLWVELKNLVAYCSEEFVLVRVGFVDDGGEEHVVDQGITKNKFFTTGDKEVFNRLFIRFKELPANTTGYVRITYKVKRR